MEMVALTLANIAMEERGALPNVLAKQDLRTSPELDAALRAVTDMLLEQRSVTRQLTAPPIASAQADLNPSMTNVAPCAAITLYVATRSVMGRKAVRLLAPAKLVTSRQDPERVLLSVAMVASSGLRSATPRQVAGATANAVRVAIRPGLETIVLRTAVTGSLLETNSAMDPLVVGPTASASWVTGRLEMDNALQCAVMD